MQVAAHPAKRDRPATGCCPRFDPAPWQDQEITWSAKPFVREHVHSLFHVPLDMGRRIASATATLEAHHAQPERPLILSDEQSPWRSELYLEATRDVPGAEMAHLSGTYLTKVFEGPFRDAGKWMREMTRYVQARGRHLEKLYFGYTTCPACAKAYGENYVVLLAKVADGTASSS